MADPVAAVSCTLASGGRIEVAERPSSFIRNLAHKKQKAPDDVQRRYRGIIAHSGLPTLARPLKLR
jgi:hypothetical protein